MSLMQAWALASCSPDLCPIYTKQRLLHSGSFRTMLANFWKFPYSSIWLPLEGTKLFLVTVKTHGHQLAGKPSLTANVKCQANAHTGDCGHDF